MRPPRQRQGQASRSQRVIAVSGSDPSPHKLVAVDANSLLYRAFFALPHLSTRDGRPTNALYGFTMMLLRVLQEMKPESVVVAFDAHAKTFRHEEYEQYKAQRPETPQDLVAQAPLAREIVRAMGLPLVEIEGFEADDVIGTVARQADEQGYETTIVTGDLDTLQLVSPRTSVMCNVRGVAETITYDAEAVRSRFGVAPEQMVDFKALKGDPSDNIPGVPGIGEKTASALIQQFGSIENLYQRLDEVKPDRVRRLLEEGRESAFLSKRLSAIVTHVPLEKNIEDFRPEAADRDRVRELFTDLEFTSLLKRVEEAAERNVEEKAPAPAEGCKLVGSADELNALLKRLATARKLAVRVDLAGASPLDAEIAGIVLASGSDDACYVCIAPEGPADGTGQLDFEGRGYQARLEEIQPVLEAPDLAKIGHNLKVDCEALQRRGVRLRGIDFDVMIAAYCLDPGRSGYVLADLARQFLEMELPAVAEAADFDPDRALNVCAAAAAVCELEPVLTARLKENGLDRLMAEVEMPLVEILAGMELRGVCIDPKSLQALSADLDQRIAQTAQEIYAEAGMEFNIGSAKQVQFVLFEKLGLQADLKKKTKSGGFSTSASVLEAIAPTYPIVAKILEYRELTKIKSTYADSLPRLVNPRTGRVHTSLNQAVTATGRLSSSEPNLQNIPIRTELGREIRKAFVAAPGTVLLSADYSQIELRILAHVTADEELVRAFQQDEDIHTHTATRLFNVEDSQVTPEMRRQAKTVNFAVIYGMSDFGLSQALNVPREVAHEWITSYFARFPGVKKYTEETVAKARETGYVCTLLGRRRYIPDIRSSNRNLRMFAERAAVNMPIQGTAADIIKLAMIKVHEHVRDRDDAAMLLQVHDELLFEVSPSSLSEIASMVKQEMETAIALDVPVKVDVKAGPNWAEMEAVSL